MPVKAIFRPWLSGKSLKKPVFLIQLCSGAGNVIARSLKWGVPDVLSEKEKLRPPFNQRCFDSVGFVSETFQAET